MKLPRTKSIRKPASPGVLASMMLLAVVGASAAVSDTGITPEGGAIRIKAGVLERVIRVSGGNGATESLTVSGAPLIAGPADEWSFRITRAEPNRNPLELPINSGGPALDVSEAKANDTDALKVSGKVKPGTKPAGDNSSERPSNPANPQQILTPVSDAFRTIRRRMARYRASPPKPRPARIPMNTKKDTQSPIERPDGRRSLEVRVRGHGDSPSGKQSSGKEWQINLIKTLGSLVWLSAVVLSVGVASAATESMSLAGSWGFRMDPQGEGEAKAWFASGMEESIQLPGTMDEGGKGIPNTRRDFTDHLSRERIYQGLAWYQRKIEIPRSWDGKRITLELERTRFTSVWLDERRVGDHLSLGCAQVFDLSGMAKPGRHVLTIRVDNRPRKELGSGHMITDHTQVNWNGILGRIELRATDPVWIENANIRPVLATRSVRVKLKLGNRTGKPAVAAVALAARSTTGDHQVPARKTEVTIPPGGTTAEIHYPLGEGALVWDEFTPHLYEMTIGVSSGNFADEDAISFGLREFGRSGTQFTINGRKTFLRGKCDSLVWPLTGYAPMDVAAWVRVMRIAKDYGINHYRFHSCTPPAAAFIAADQVGIYVQPELYHFGSDLSRHPEGIRYAKEEGRRILETYGNHPSFVMMTLGNEMRDGREARAGVIRELHAFDPGRLYAQASNYDFRNLKLEPGDDYWTTIRTAPGAAAAVRGSFSHVNLPLGHIQVNPPSTMVDFSAAIRDIPVPVIGHETGQFQVYPNLSEVSKYTGVQKPWNFEVFAQRLRKAGMFDQRDEFVRASGALAVLCYREDIEAALRTPGFGGFHLLDLQDFPGQGTALVGILDAFMDSKGLITPEQWREFCSPVVPLARLAKYTWVSGEAFTPRLEIANYGVDDLDGRTLRARLSVDGGRVLDEVSLPLAAVKSGEVSEVATLAWKLPSMEKAAKLSLVLEVPGTEIRNTYPLWLYPLTSRPEPPAGIRVLRKMDAEVMKALGQGESVLLIPEPDPGSNSVEGFFASDFWCFPMFRQIATSNGKEVAPGTLGILCDPAHPALAGFPTEFHSNWQWWQLVMHSRPVILDATPPSFRPIVQVIDNFERNHKLGLVFECTVGKGRLLVCAVNLPQLMEHPEARQFHTCLLGYMDSPAFAPKTALEPAEVAALFAPRGKRNGGDPTIDYSEFFNAGDSKVDR